MRYLFIASLITLYGCTQSNTNEANTTYSCIGEITLNNTEVNCRQSFEKYTYFMSLGEKVDISSEGCSWVHFNYKKMQRIENTDLRLTYEYKYKEKDTYFTQNLTVNKMNGEYSFWKASGEHEEIATQRGLILISGVCKKTDKVIG